jgi:hypothetical protein
MILTAVAVVGGEGVTDLEAEGRLVKETMIPGKVVDLTVTPAADLEEAVVVDVVVADQVLVVGQVPLGRFHLGEVHLDLLLPDEVDLLVAEGVPLPRQRLPLKRKSLLMGMSMTTSPLLQHSLMEVLIHQNLSLVLLLDLLNLLQQLLRLYLLL